MNRVQSMIYDLSENKIDNVEQNIEIEYLLDLRHVLMSLAYFV